MHYGGKKQLLRHHLMYVTVCVFWFVRTNVERRRKSLNPLCLRGLWGWGGSIIGLLPIHSLCHVTSAPHRLVELSPSRISIFSPPFLDSSIEDAIWGELKPFISPIQGLLSFIPDGTLSNLRTHPTLPNQRERKGQWYTTRSPVGGNDVGCGGVGNEIGGLGEQMNRH